MAIVYKLHTYYYFPEKTNLLKFGEFSCLGRDYLLDTVLHDFDMQPESESDAFECIKSWQFCYLQLIVNTVRACMNNYYITSVFIKLLQHNISF